MAQFKRTFHAANGSLPRSTRVAGAHKVPAGGGRLTSDHSLSGRGQTWSFAVHRPATSICMCLLCTVVSGCCESLYLTQIQLRKNTDYFYTTPYLQVHRSSVGIIQVEAIEIRCRPMRLGGITNRESLQLQPCSTEDGADNSYQKMNDVVALEPSYHNPLILFVIKSKTRLPRVLASTEV